MAAKHPSSISPGSLADLEARVELLERSVGTLMSMLATPDILAANAKLYQTMQGMVVDMVGMLRVMQTKGLATITRGMEPAPAAPAEEDIAAKMERIVGVMASAAGTAAEAMAGGAE